MCGRAKGSDPYLKNGLLFPSMPSANFTYDPTSEAPSSSRRRYGSILRASGCSKVLTSAKAATLPKGDANYVDFKSVDSQVREQLDKFQESFVNGNTNTGILVRS